MSVPEPVTNLGSGYNTFRQSAAPTILHVDDRQPGGVSSASNAFFCMSKEDVYQALDVSAGLSASSAWGSFSDKFEFVNKLHLNTTSIVILVSATRVTESFTLEAASFKSPQGSASSVYKHGGDSYVSAITKGAAFIAAYSFVSYDNQTYKNLVNSANTSFSVAGGTFGADFGANVTNIQKETGVTFKQEQVGIGFSNVPLPDSDHLVDFVLNFSKVDPNGPTVLSFSLDSYTEIPGCPDFTQIDAYRALYDDPDTGYAARVLAAQTHKAAIKSVFDIYDCYGCSKVDPKLMSVPAKLDEDSQNIAQWLEAVSTDPTRKNIKAPMLSTVDGFGAGLPIVQYTLIQGDTSAGGSGGREFIDVQESDILVGMLPSEISIKGGAWVDHISTTYTYADVGRAAVPFQHGDDGGGAANTIQLQRGEYVTGAQAAFGLYVNYLRVTTNEQVLVGPDNPDGAEGFAVLYDSNTAVNSCFVGWCGASGSFLDNLRALFVRFSAASWV